MDTLYTVEQVAAKYQVKVGTVRAWVKQKRIGFQKIGRLVRFTADDLKRGVSSKHKSRPALRLVGKLEP